MSDKKRKTTTKKTETETKKTKQTKLSKEGKIVKEVASEEEEEEVIQKKPKKNSSDGELFNVSTTDVSTVTKVREDEDKYFKIISWNVNGFNGLLKKSNFAEYIVAENPDIICLGETKTSDGKEPDIKKLLTKWDKAPKSYWNNSIKKKGYSGTAVFTKSTAAPLNVTYGITDMEDHNQEGRVITLEYDKYYLVNSYVPNAGQKLEKLDYKQEWDKDFSKYLNDLKKKKHVILTGDLNVAHQEIDLENPKTNQKTAGFTKEERKDFTDFLNTGWVDTFRIRNPNMKKAYTYWSFRRQARSKDVGWRIDYFVVNKDFDNYVVESYIRKTVHGSDHCPVGLLIKKEIEDIKQEKEKK